MPTISTKTPLGSIFGGKITSLSYNFQTGGESSSATIVVYNDNGSYQEPSLNSEVSLPIFQSKMRVLETAIIDDSTIKYLQVELEDSSAKLLDETIVLIRGIHSTGLDDDLIESELHSFYRYGAVSDNAISRTVLAKPDFKKASSNTSPRKLFDGVWLMGRIRASYTPSSEITWSVVNTWKPGDQPLWVKYQGRQYNATLSRWPNLGLADIENAIREDGGVSIEYGWTLKDLKGFIQNLGFSVIDKQAMDDDVVLFNDTGSVRNILGAALSKIGRSFYIDPFSKAIVVISNSDIQRINSNVIDLVSNINTVGGAEQTSLVKSIKGVSSNHVVIKGSIGELSSQLPEIQFEKNKVRRLPFFKLQTDRLISELVDERTKQLISKILYLKVIGIQESIIDKYIFGLAQSEDTSDWGSSYNNTDVKKVDFEPKPEKEDEVGPSGIDWQVSPKELPSLNGFDTRKTIGAYRLIRDRKPLEEKSDSNALTASSQGFLSLIDNIARLWSGVYFSNSSTLRRVQKRRFISSEYSFIIASADEYISNVPELSFIQESLKETESNPNLKVSDLATSSGAVSRSNEYHVIAIKNAFQGSVSSDTITNVTNKVNSSSVILAVDSGGEESNLMLLVNDEFVNVTKGIKNMCMTKFKEEKKSIKSRVVLRYIIDDSSPSGSGNEEDEGDSDETPSISSLTHVPSKINNFSSRNLLFIDGPFEEVEILKENLSEINPEISGPMISSEISYYRPPRRDDLDINNGVDSISVSMNSQGVTTRVRYSTKKFLSYDQQVLVNYLGSSFNYNSPRQGYSETNFGRKLRLQPAFKKNNQGQ